jgi:H+/gluconate symporter-like permease
MDSKSSEEEKIIPQDEDKAISSKKPASFWLSILALMIATFLAAMDTVSNTPFEFNLERRMKW